MITHSLKLAALSSLLAFFILFLNNSDSYAALEQQKPDSDINGGTLDEQFATLSILLPGFAGAFFDEEDNFVIAISKDSEFKYPEDIMQTLSESKINLSILDDILESASRNNFLVQEATYDFASLHEWHMTISKKLMSDQNVIFTDADEVRNRIVIGVNEISEKEKYFADISALGIPNDAVIIKKTEPIVEGLEQTRRPTGGGSKIRGRGNCSLGVNVRYFDIDDGIFRNGFLTNAHCTHDRHQVTGTIFKQINSPIGTEIKIAPRIFTNCNRPGQLCYYADVALVKYSPGVPTQGKINRTALWDPNCHPGAANCPIDSQDPIFPVQGKSNSQFVGQELHKVGQTTGWTKGKVESTCVNVSTGTTTLFCQNFVKKGPNAPQNQPIFTNGDSGSAAFKIVSSKAVIAGINWGYSGNDRWIYAPWGNISSTVKGVGFNTPTQWGNGYIWQN